MTRTRPTATVTHGLIIRPEPLARILDGRKVWEIRGTRTHLRGPIALIEAGSSHIVGVAEIVDVIGPMRSASLSNNPDKTGYSNVPVEYDRYFAWVVEHARRLSRPVRYEHPNGAVIWVRLGEEVAGRVRAQSKVNGTRCRSS